VHKLAITIHAIKAYPSGAEIESVAKAYKSQAARRKKTKNQSQTTEAAVEQDCALCV